MEKEKNIVYSDFDIMFRKNALTGDVIHKINQEDIKQSLHLLLRTRFYERKWNPLYGSSLNELLFKENTSYLHDLIKLELINLIETYEPRIELTSIFVGNETAQDESSGKVSIRLEYIIIPLNVTDSYTYVITRTR